MPSFIGVQGILLLTLLFILLFGVKRLPQAGRSLAGACVSSSTRSPAQTRARMIGATAESGRSIT
jgi:Sec-independent protein translocase protein TatA